MSRGRCHHGAPVTGHAGYQPKGSRVDLSELGWHARAITGRWRRAARSVEAPTLGEYSEPGDEEEEAQQEVVEDWVPWTIRTTSMVESQLDKTNL